MHIVLLGASPFINQIAMMIVQIVMNNSLSHYGALSSYGSEIPLACSGIIAKVNMVLFSMIIGISQACSQSPVTTMVPVITNGCVKFCIWP